MPKKRILIIDDEKDIVTFVKDFLADEGYEISVALCAEEAKKKLDLEEHVLAVLDMKMPGLDGPSLLEMINKEHPQTKVVILTGYGRQYADKVKGMAFQGFMTKPFSAMDLVRTVKNILDGKTSPAEERLALYNDPHAMPQAKLMFIEPNELAAGGKMLYFKDRQRCGGRYEIAIVVSASAVKETVQSFKPDIVLGDISMLGSSGGLRSDIMNSKFKPKDIIAYGSVSDDDASGVPVVRGSFDTLSTIFVKGMIDKLGKVVREACIRNDLYAKVTEPVNIPGLALKRERAEAKKEKKPVTIDQIPQLAKGIIAKELKVSEDKIKDNTLLEKELGMDLYASIQIIMSLEEELGIEIPDNESERLYRFRDVVKYLQKKIRK